MARYEHLPIWADAMKLSVGIERAVAGFSRYHKYSLGAELRRSAMQLLGLVVRAARASAQRGVELERLVLTAEQIKAQLALARELKTFKSFTIWADLAALSVTISKQSEGWLQQARRATRPEAAPDSGGARA